MVVDRLGVEGVRKGAATALQRDKFIRDGVIKVQSIIPEFTVNHETLYRPEDLVVEGMASKGIKPPQSAINDAYLVKITTTDSDGNELANPAVSRFPLMQVAWADRFALVKGAPCVNDGIGCIAIDPKGYQFYVFPEVFDCWLLSMFWDGLKLDFKEDELTPFTEEMAGTVAHYVRAEIAREISKNMDEYRSFRQSFNEDKTLLFVNAREKASVQMVGVGTGGGHGSWNGECESWQSSSTAECVQQFFTYAGDPNGYVPPSANQFTTLPLQCLDTVNKVIWVKDDGILGNTGWH